jgi:hypothetical protein
MRSRFLIFTLFLAVMCIGSASNAMAQSATGTGVIPLGDGGAPITITVSAQQGGNGGVMRIGSGQNQVVAQPVDICVQSNAAFVVAQVTHSSNAGDEGQFLQLGFFDNGKDGDFIAVPFGILSIVPDQVPACDLFLLPASPLGIERGGFQVKP